MDADNAYMLMVATGFCGAFNIKSSFAFETANLLEGNQFMLFAFNIIATVGLSLGAVIDGRELGNVVMERFVS